MKRLSTDKDGVVSFEYVIVAACIIGAVVAAFGTGTGGAIATALTSGITAIASPVHCGHLIRSDSRGGPLALRSAPTFFEACI